MKNAKDAEMEVIDFDASADLIEESEVAQKLDLGHSYLYRLRHPIRGHIAVLNAACGHCAVIQM